MYVEYNLNCSDVQGFINAHHAGKKFSRRHFEIFLIFPSKYTLTFIQTASLGDNFHKMSKPFFLVKNDKNIISLSSAEFAQMVIKVKASI